MTFTQLGNFYRNKRVWLSGHTGFKGSWMSYWLTLMGAKVGGYALAPEKNDNSLFALLALENKIERSTINDIRNCEAVRADMSAFNPDIVVHMAAQPLVRRSYREPIETYETNVMGTAHVLDAARYAPNVKAVVCVTTDKCYENMESKEPYRETDRLGGYDPYSSSKACAELVASSWRQSFLRDKNISLATARGGNVLGGGDFSEDRIVPDLIRAIRREEPLIMRAPQSIRPWQHVLDAVHGYLLLGQKLYTDGDAYAEAFNFSPADQSSVTVQDIVDGLIAKIKRGAYKIDPAAGDLHETATLRLDPSKAMARLNWKIGLTMDECLAYTADWYDAYLRGLSIEDITRQQIERFVQTIA